MGQHLALAQAFLALDERRGSQLLLADVSHNGDGCALPERRDRERHGNNESVLAKDVDLSVLNDFAPKRLLDEGLTFPQTVVSDELRHRKPNRLGVVVAEEVAGAPVPAGHRATAVEAENGVVGGGEDGGQERFAIGCSGARMLGDAANVGHEALRRPPTVEQSGPDSCCR